LEGEPPVQGRRCCLSASRQTIAPAWGAGRMRTDEKLKIVLESLRTPRQIFSTARRYGISRSLLTRWRRAFRAEHHDAAARQIGFVPGNGGPGTRGDACASRLGQRRGDRDRVCGRGSDADHGRGRCGDVDSSRGGAGRWTATMIPFTKTQFGFVPPKSKKAVWSKCHPHRVCDSAFLAGTTKEKPPHGGFKSNYAA
jgi:Transposase